MSAAKDHLQKKILKLEERMRALEDALAIAQNAEGDEPHPLLQQPFKIDDAAVEEEEQEEASDENEQIAEALSDSFGTLHIDQRQKTLRFYGPSGGVEVCALPCNIR